MSGTNALFDLLAQRKKGWTTRPHDFAVRVQHRSSAVLTIASIASRPASVTIASAPQWDETARLSRCFASRRNVNIFAIAAGQVICPSGTERCGAVALAHGSRHCERSEAIQL